MKYTSFIIKADMRSKRAYDTTMLVRRPVTKDDWLHGMEYPLGVRVGISATSMGALFSLWSAFAGLGIAGLDQFHPRVSLVSPS